MLAARWLGMVEQWVRLLAVAASAMLVGCVLRGRLRDRLKDRYPDSRWIGLLSSGYALISFGVVARFVIPGVDETRLFWWFLLPAAVSIGLFVVINRRDPDVLA